MYAMHYIFPRRTRGTFIKNWRGGVTPLCPPPPGSAALVLSDRDDSISQTLWKSELRYGVENQGQSNQILRRYINNAVGPSVKSLSEKKIDVSVFIQNFWINSKSSRYLLLMIKNSKKKICFVCFRSPGRPTLSIMSMPTFTRVSTVFREVQYQEIVTRIHYDIQLLN